MINEIIKNYIDSGNTLLGIGPMSINIVDAALEIANSSDIPIMLIASRRQIDDKNILRGYVNNWSTDEFASYVRNKQKKNNVILARDHGGPYQNNIEICKRYSLKDAMKSAKESYIKDIESGFDILHIDPSIDIFQQLSFEKIFERLTELYEFSSDYASKINKNIEFEIGTEEQMVHLNNINEFSSILKKVQQFCLNNNLKLPLFVVSQIGTKVMETKNIGLLNQEDNYKLKNNINELCNAALMNGFYIKVHNTDYLDSNILRLFPQMKISAANIAPEFGVCETKSFLSLLERYNLLNLENQFLELAYNSKKWQKWILSDSLPIREKAIIAGHYIFSNPEFLKIKDSASKIMKEINVDEYLKESVKACIMKYINLFSAVRIEKNYETEKEGAKLPC